MDLGKRVIPRKGQYYPVVQAVHVPIIYLLVIGESTASEMIPFVPPPPYVAGEGVLLSMKFDTFTPQNGPRYGIRWSYVMVLSTDTYGSELGIIKNLRMPHTPLMWDNLPSGNDIVITGYKTALKIPDDMHDFLGPWL
jgi:hypothetical protein